MAWDKKAPFDAKGNMLDWDGYWGVHAPAEYREVAFDGVVEVTGFSRGRSSHVVHVRCYPEGGDPFNATWSTQQFFDACKGMAVSGSFANKKVGSRHHLEHTGPASAVLEKP